MSWFVSPEIVRLDLPGGEWVDVKKQLTIGEERRQMASLVKEVRQDGRMTPDFEMVGKAEVLAYLVDWSLKGLDGKTERIDTETRKAAALDKLHPQKFKVIADAINAHVAALAEASEQGKNGQSSGETASEATSVSVA